MSNKDYGEVLLQSTEQIVDSKLSMVKFDQTIICTIIDDSNAFNGEYQVSDGSVTFTAYSENRNYTKNSQVYVLIPQGNWANRKQITALYSKSEDIIVRKRKKDELVVIKKSETVEKLENDTSQIPISFDGSYYNIELVNTLYITFKIQTDLSPDSIFNIDVKISVTDGNGEQTTFVLSSYSNDQMLGNSSYYYTPVQQEIICSLDKDIISFPFITAVTLDFPLHEKINITDIDVYLCHDVSSYKNNTALIFPIDSINKYNGGGNQPTMKLIWVNKDKYGKYIGFNDGSFNKEKAKGLDVNNGIIINGYESINLDSGKNYYWIEWYRDTQSKRLEIDEQFTNVEEYVYDPLLAQFANSEIQVKIWKNGISYESNIFTFQNILNEKLVVDSLLRLNDGKSFDANSNQIQVSSEPEEKDNGWYIGYSFYPNFTSGVNAGKPIKFAPGQSIEFLEDFDLYENNIPQVVYTTTEYGENGPVYSTQTSRDLASCSPEIELVDGQSLQIKLYLEVSRASIIISDLKVSNISSLCFTTKKQTSSTELKLLDENDLYNRLNAAEARIQQLEKQLSAYI